MLFKIKSKNVIPEVISSYSEEKRLQKLRNLVLKLL